MDLNLLFPGSLVYVPGMLDSPTSSCVLLVEDEKKILVDPGGFPSLEILEDRLTSLGLSPDGITDIFLTHFHLDHAFNSMFSRTQKFICMRVTVAETTVRLVQ
ncbi:MBL fold metallo-hydrolase [Mesotoga sp. Brook.08.YT.4.2.5.1]|uniref:MBL fold metallo-hydrolase n=1 Tax=Mesotoga sp. Brook.08.YT.4.2.5.1 TaxID=1421001 RepID=UPI0021556A4F|nr:MBL fold metallo-hydrolase [Mesotoga sp. Brook.08.YT.4.2.5.1]